MAGVITHLVIANEILNYLPVGTIEDVGLFCLGSFAPDAIHAREDYIRAYKKHTHFRDDIPDKDFEQKDNYTLYKSRLVEFINVNNSRTDGLLDLYRGYVVHILTDELFVLSLRKEFSTELEKRGIKESDRRFFEYIVADMNRNDMLLVENYVEIDKIRTQLEQVRIHPIEGYISNQEMKISKEWLLLQHFYNKHELLQPDYISYERMIDFIHISAKEITKRLSEGISLPKML